MRNLLKKYLIFIFLFFISFSINGQPYSKWHYPLYLANMDYWRMRIPIQIENTSAIDVLGEPVTLKVGTSPGQLNIEGESLAGIRIINSNNNELLWRINRINGQQINEGIIPAGSILTIPATVKSGIKETFYIYFNNPSAWGIEASLKSHREITNGGFELNEADNPIGWKLQDNEEGQKAELSTELPHSGKYCIKINHDSINQKSKCFATQSEIYIQGGEKYRFEGWVKAKNSKGTAGWRINFGNVASHSNDFSVQEQFLDGGPGTYDWKKVSGEFTAPEDTNSANITTLLKGTGTAWFDDFEITSLSKKKLNIQIKPLETIVLDSKGKDEKWPKELEWNIRIPFKIMNFTKEAIRDLPVYVDLEQALLRVHDKVDETTPFKLGIDIAKSYVRFENALLFESPITAQTEQTKYAYFASEEKHNAKSLQLTYDKWLMDKRNLVKNANITKGESSWKRISSIALPKNAIQSLITNDKEDGKYLQLYLPKSGPLQEIGWTQNIDIKPNHTYMFGAMIKCKDIAHDVSIKIKLLGNDQIPLKTQFTSNSVNGTADWKYVSGVFDAPENSTEAEINLSHSEAGEVFFKGILFMEVFEGYSSSLFFEQRQNHGNELLDAWQVNPIEKIFQENLPPENKLPLQISVAKNETEPIQIALRSNKSFDQLKIELSPLKNQSGQVLENVEANVVGYVPVTYPSGYYRTEVPYWQLKTPTEKIGSDGWIGLWPDPLLPNKTFKLMPNTTQPIWIEVSVPENARPGDYMGQILILENDSLIKEIPWTVHVWNFALPKKLQFGALYDLRSPNRQFYNELNLTEFRDMNWSFMAKHKICSGEIIPSPKINYKDNQVTADFTEFDKAATYYFNVLKNPYAYFPNELFYLFGWAFPPDQKFGENPYEGDYPYENANHNLLRQEYKNAYQRVLRAFWNHVKEKGWADKFVLYLSDEPHEAENGKSDIDAQMKALCNMIHEVDSKIPIYASTWWYRPEWEGYINIWGLGFNGEGDYGHNVTKEDLQHIKQSGGRIWFTTDGHFCTETPYMAIERLLPTFAFKYGADAYEFWGVNWLTNNPYKNGSHNYIFESQAPGEAFWIRYPNGDGYIIYPGKPIGEKGLIASIRLKQVRDGIEDFEYLSLLSQLIKQAKSKGENIDSAQKALDNALELVNIPCAMGRYSTKIIKNPEDVLKVREQIAIQIEKLINQ